MSLIQTVDLPVIDLSFLQSKFDVKSEKLQTECCTKIREAAEELGFFHVINHGIDLTLVHAVDSIVRDMFKLPAEAKERALSPIFYDGYAPPEHSMPESMCLTGTPLSNSIRNVSDKIWPQGNSKFCETVDAYSRKVTDLSNTIMKLIIRSLGLDISKYFETEFGKCEGWIRMNYYHARVVEESSDDELLIAKAHTDISCITILYQDDVGGLQVRTKEGRWINVKPLTGSFVVNIGDPLKMWSNGRYRSAEHRVIYGGRRNRLSLAFLMDFQQDQQICAPAELIDNDHPRLYKALTFKDFKDHYRQLGPSLKHATDFLINPN